MRCWVGAAVAGFLFTAASAGAPAAYADSDLTGIDQISVGVTGLDKDAAACGITEQVLKQAFMYPASGAKFKVVPVNMFVAPNMDIAVIYGTINSGNTCICALTLNLTSFQSVQLLPYGRYAVGAQILLWQHQELMWAGKQMHLKQVTEAVERSAKSFITKWNLANK